MVEDRAIIELHRIITENSTSIESVVVSKNKVPQWKHLGKGLDELSQRSTVRRGDNTRGKGSDAFTPVTPGSRSATPPRRFVEYLSHPAAPKQ